MTTLLAEANPDQGEQNVDYVAYVTDKFKKEDGSLDIEALAKGKYFADKTVEQRDFTIDQMREQITSSTSLEKVLEQIKSMTTPTQTPSTPATPPNEQVANVQPDLKAVVAKEFQNLQTLAQKQANIDMVRDELKKAWGPSFATQLKNVGASLGLSEQQLEDMAATAPKALLALAKPAPQADVSVPRTQKNAMANASDSDRTPVEKHYDDMLKNDPNTYFTPRVQSQLWNLIKEGKYRIKTV